MASESLYVFVEIQNEPVVAGKLTITTTVEGRLGRFVYGQSYLRRNDAFALDPINLPLEEREFLTPNENYILGVFNDAAPDLWGKRIIESLDPTPAATDLKYLLVGSGQGVGALYFSRTPNKVEIPALGADKHVANLSKMQRAAAALERKEELSETLKHYLKGGLSMGGVRPKTILRYRNTQWLAKFPMQADLYDCQKAEFAALQMAGAAGIRVPNCLLIETELGSVLLVERFDRIDGRRQHFISANSLLDTPRKLRQSEYTRHASYANIADVISRISAQPQADRQELFQRMIFNIAIANGDDHLKNHGFLKQENSHLYRLSPAYDMLTQPATGLEKRQAIVVGSRGLEASFENALSHSGRFGLSLDEAENVIDKTLTVIGRRGEYFDLANLADGDRRELERRIAIRLEERQLAPATSPALRIQNANLLMGEYRGKLVDQVGQHVIQQLGANRGVAHHTICFDAAPVMGEYCQINYRAGELVMECKQSVKKSLTHDRGIE